MMALSALTEAAGLFDWLALQAARLAGRGTFRIARTSDGALPGFF
jgi:Na+/H+ antiporter NhaD/arsenite permease-like protein